MKKVAMAMLTVVTVLASAIAAPLGAGAADEVNAVVFSTGSPAGGWSNVSQEEVPYVHRAYKGGSKIELPFNRIDGADISKMTWLEFDLYTKDANLFSLEGSEAKIRFTSSGDIYDNSMDFNADVLAGVKLKAGDWTHVRLPLSKAVDGGGQHKIDLTAVNYLRLEVQKTPGAASEDKEIRLRNILFTDGKNLEVTAPGMEGLAFDRTPATLGASWRIQDNKLLTTQHISANFETTATNIGDFEATFKINIFEAGKEGLNIYLDNGYRMQVRTHSTAPHLVVYRPANGGFNTSEFKMENGKEHNVKVRVSGGVIEIFVNDMENFLIHEEMVSGADQSGKLKFEAMQTKLTLDDLRIVTLKSDGAEDKVVYESNFDTKITVKADSGNDNSSSGGNSNPNTGADLFMPAMAAVIGASALGVLVAARRKNARAD